MTNVNFKRPYGGFMEKTLLILMLVLSTAAMATPAVLIQNGTFTPGDPGEAQVVVHSNLGDGKLYVAGAAGGNVPLSSAVSGLSISTTTASNASTTVETDLASYSVSANTLSAAGHSVKLVAAGTFASNADTNKRLRAYIGSTAFVDTGSMSFTGIGSWKLDGECVRVASTSQKCAGAIWTSYSSYPTVVSYSTAAESLGSAVTVKVTGASATASTVIGEVFEVLLKQ